MYSVLYSFFEKWDNNVNRETVQNSVSDEQTHTSPLLPNLTFALALFRNCPDRPDRFTKRVLSGLSRRYHTFGLLSVGGRPKVPSLCGGDKVLNRKHLRKDFSCLFVHTRCVGNFIC
jgi:hypothetical protein